jgi:hypothetical protein
MHSCFVFFILDEVKEERTVKERDVLFWVGTQWRPFSESWQAREGSDDYLQLKSKENAVNFKHLMNCLLKLI